MTVDTDDKRCAQDLLITGHLGRLKGAHLCRKGANGCYVRTCFVMESMSRT